MTDVYIFHQSHLFLLSIYLFPVFVMPQSEVAWVRLPVIKNVAETIGLFPYMLKLKIKEAVQRSPREEVFP